MTQAAIHLILGLVLLQVWTVPATGQYSVQLAGAPGGGTINHGGGAGAAFTVPMALSLPQGAKLYLVVGQNGPGANYGAGGGGGTFVFYSLPNGQPQLVAVAGERPWLLHTKNLGMLKEYSRLCSANDLLVRSCQQVLAQVVVVALVSDRMLGNRQLFSALQTMSLCLDREGLQVP